MNRQSKLQQFPGQVNGRRVIPPDIRPESVPPPPDEAYWKALLSEGEPGAAPLDPLDALDPSVQESDWEDYADWMPAPSHEREGQDWEQAEALFNEDRTIELTVIGYNRGGLLVEWNSLRGFVPASQLIDSGTPAEQQNRRQYLLARVNQTLVLRIIELDRVQNRLILSERAAQVRPGTRANVLDNIHPGGTVSGRVTNLCEFGAFVDLGGLEGLIHISELSWGRVSHPRDILRRGQDIRAYVMEVHRDQGRIALSLKRLLPDPWQTVATRYQVGQVVEGVITNIVDFGAFACVEEGLEGLIHVSELAEGHFLHPRNVVQEGDRVHARILNIDGRNRRLGLSLREHVPAFAQEASSSS
jgi:small subunit ribosomal protein S1